MIFGVFVCNNSSVIKSCAVYYLWYCFLYSGYNYARLQFQESVIKILDTLYHDRDYARFYVLETIARVPYFGNDSMHFILHRC